MLLLHTIVSYAMNRREAICVFSSLGLAEKFIKNNNSNFEIESISVQGNQKLNSKTIYSGHKYRASDDIYYLVGLYWDYDEAKRNSGDNPLIKNFEIDERL